MSLTLLCHLRLELLPPSPRALPCLELRLGCLAELQVRHEAGEL